MSKTVTRSTTSNFQYRLESDIEKKLGQLEENALDFITQFEKGDFTYNELEMIARNLESSAQYFGEQYGLGGTRLLSMTKAYVDHRKKQIIFENKAKDDYERYYAGFVEYGHRTKNGFVPARPFMRNALYAVSKASTGQIEEALGELLSNIFRLDNSGYQGVSSLTFGNKLGEAYHYSLPNFGAVNSFKSALEQRQKGRSQKTFGEYSAANKTAKQASFTRGNRRTKKFEKVESAFLSLNKDADITVKSNKGSSKSNKGSSKSNKKGKNSEKGKKGSNKKGPKKYSNFKESEKVAYTQGRRIEIPDFLIQNQKLVKRAKNSAKRREKAKRAKTTSERKTRYNTHNILYGD